MKKSIPVSAAICVIALLAICAQAQNTVSYTLTSFEVPFTGASNTKAFAINSAGDIVGRYFDSTQGGNPRGFLRHSDGTYAPPIDVPVANTGTVARGINARGDIVGKYFDPTLAGETHGFYLGVDGTFTSFDVTLAGAIPGSTVAQSINNRGQIVGRYGLQTVVSTCTVALPLHHGFLRNTDGSFTAIDYPGASATSAVGIDDGGNIVGTYAVPASTPPSSCDANMLVTAHGFLRDPKGNYTTVDPPGALETLISRINDEGDVTGAYSTSQLTIAELLKDTPLPSGTVVNSFVLWVNGAFTSFVIPNGIGSPLGINPRGNIVGVYTDGAGDHGFIGTK